MENDKIVYFINELMDDNKNKEVEELFVSFLDDAILKEYDEKIRGFVKDFQYNASSLNIKLDKLKIQMLELSFSNVLKNHNFDDYEISSVGLSNLLIMYCNKKGYDFEYYEDMIPFDFKWFIIKINI